MSERSLMKNKLLQLSEQHKLVEKTGRTLCDQIGKAVNPLLYELVDMDIAGAAALMDELVVKQAELISLSYKISSLKKELYD